MSHCVQMTGEMATLMFTSAFPNLAMEGGVCDAYA